MAKGAYTVICYREDLEREGLTIEDIVERALGMGAECAYILHDRDRYDSGENKGELKKAHYHLVLGWERGFPCWSDFVAWQKANFCLSPSPKGAKRQTKYYEPTARVKSIYGIMHYLTHEEWAEDADEIDETEDIAEASEDG